MLAEPKFSVCEIGLYALSCGNRAPQSETMYRYLRATLTKTASTVDAELQMRRAEPLLIRSLGQSTRQQ